MSKENGNKKITITEEQASRAAEAILNSWLRSDETVSTNKDSTKKK
ncbi:hypothetical protein B0P06_004664 [Clostridium saccharoperbutylacetonicum]|uniref:Uncharacterized protein n=1 Tax=Clostridium saccharoperbutylacetonicum N1-4(HMT) TaxID=931276 RepID=M1MGJ7_9CLOT|nr:hypothetical protein [Clostridium saccharoperbutylacetonicum]AGF57049.1 hypothetical protein Cspa_c32880 [Clostridium saccharoperbutylacetonicum N1-4(HMT)]NRT62192.1 hypothetical protein [Clostridium saccharoperbutylacetonicum]NSB25523.1 hypothetical protein [Clostridium saccharoperbutylacetonicum]NSB44893.1 hypothetical protein [Clostridium saccharoperbutylacetonicum]